MPACRPAGLPGFLLGGLDEIFGAVHANGLASRAHAPGDQSRAVSEAASHIEHMCTFRVIAIIKRPIAVRRKTIDQQVLESTKLVEQNGVPRFDDDVVCFIHSTFLRADFRWLDAGD